MANMSLMAMAYGNNSMAPMGIQRKSMEKPTQLRWFQLNRSIPAKVVAV